MAQFGPFRLPGLAATVNVARETLRSWIPEPGQCWELLQKMRGVDVQEGGNIRRSSHEMADYGGYVFLFKNIVVKSIELYQALLFG